jgi:threonine/homoserine/homoserine lactone efflux protein
MSYTENLSLFALLVFGIIAVPGMDMLYVMTNGLTGGRGKALAATAGVMAGGVVHTTWGALSVGVILSLSPVLLQAMLFVGAAYLAWIGVTLIRSAITVDAPGGGPARTGWTAFRQGAVSCLINPKAYAFMFTVFPQFVKPVYGPVWIQALAMGSVTMLFQLAVYGSLGLVAAAGRGRALTRPGLTIALGKGAGWLFVGIAGLTVWHAVEGLV